MYRDADLLLGAYYVPLEYDEALIRQVGTAAVLLAIGCAPELYCCYSSAQPQLCLTLDACKVCALRCDLAV